MFPRTSPRSNSTTSLSCGAMIENARRLLEGAMSTSPNRPAGCGVGSADRYRVRHEDDASAEENL
jgi:hypothetical protein